MIDYSSDDVIDHYNSFEPLQEQDFDTEDVGEVIGAVVAKDNNNNNNNINEKEITYE